MSRTKVTRESDPMPVVDALYAAGPEAASVIAALSRLRTALRAQAPEIHYDVLRRSPIGPVCVAASERGVLALDFGLGEQDFVERLKHRTRAGVRRSSERVVAALRQVQEYLSGARTSFDLPLDLSWTSAFQQQVLRETLAIPRGQTRTYHQVARTIGRPRASRAVGQALGRNPVPIIIPCHRVLGSDGSLHGYSGGGGLRTKAWLLQLEGAAAQGNRSRARSDQGREGRTS
jgi:methylated-DNA-[protein]-cysteine S-methyltransferase